MQNLITDFIDRIDSFRTADDLRQEMGRRLDEVGFNRFAYLVVRAPHGPTAPFVITTYPDEWGEIYGAHDFVNFDPVVERASQSLLPFDWLAVRDREKRDRRRAIMHLTTPIPSRCPPGEPGEKCGQPFFLRG